MISKQELVDWLAAIDANDVYIHEDGMALCAADDSDAYIEIGGERDSADPTLSCMGCGGIGHDDDFCT
jgi:hypothetical protein